MSSVPLDKRLLRIYGDNQSGIASGDPWPNIMSRSVEAASVLFGGLFDRFIWALGPAFSKSLNPYNMM